ncbi:hypothetical protein WJX77_009301 [Trebouxia sp. C0004]
MITRNICARHGKPAAQNSSAKSNEAICHLTATLPFS